MVTWLRELGIIKSPEGQKCATCRYLFDYSDTEPPDEVNGYCGHPFHSTRKSPHYEYGGHWTHTEDWCRMWEAEDKQ